MDVSKIAIGGVIVDLVIILTIMVSTIWGYKKGLTSVLFKIVIFIASLIIAFILFKPVSNFIIERTGIDEWLTEKIVDTLSGTPIADGELIDLEQSNFSKNVVEIINKFVKEALNQTKVNAVNYVSSNLAIYGIRILTLIFLLGISRFILAFIKSIAEFIANLPILRLINKSGGLIIGLLRALLSIYILLAIISIILPLFKSNLILEAINSSKIGIIMYNNNLLLNLIMK